MIELTLHTTQRSMLFDITTMVRQRIKQYGIHNANLTIFVPHTTAGITINENGDPDVQLDILTHLGRMVPHSDLFRHYEDNSDAHIKASLMGSSVTVIVEDGKLLLGTWQSIYFAEFDGPRQRQIWISDGRGSKV